MLHTLNETALVAGGSTGGYTARRSGWHSVIFAGNPDGETLAAEASSDGATWLPFTASGGSAADHTAAEGVFNQIMMYLHAGLSYRWTASNGGGTLVDVFVYISGPSWAPVEG